MLALLLVLVIELCQAGGNKPAPTPNPTRAPIVGCDKVRSGCCKYNSEWGMIPTVKWADTPESEKGWFSEHNCDSVMGGKDLTNCPYTCEGCGEWKQGACRSSYDNPDFKTLWDAKTEEECQGLCQHWSNSWGDGCCQWTPFRNDWDTEKVCRYLPQGESNSYLSDFGKASVTFECGSPQGNSYRYSAAEEADETMITVATGSVQPGRKVMVNGFAAVGLAYLLYGAYKFYSRAEK